MSAQSKQFRQNVRPELRQSWDAMTEDLQYMYMTMRCATCGAHMTKRQLNRVIEGGLPVLCYKCHKRMEGQMEELQCLMGQLRLL